MRDYEATKYLLKKRDEDVEELWEVIKGVSLLAFILGVMILWVVLLEVN